MSRLSSSMGGRALELWGPTSLCFLPAPPSLPVTWPVCPFFSSPLSCELFHLVSGGL
jgi:hypothetical protein